MHSLGGHHALKMLIGGMVFITLGSYALLNFERMRYADPMPPTISVMGVGEVQAVPDIGTFSFSVTATKPTATEAQEASGSQINDILAYLKEQGIEEKDVKTENYNLYPHYRYDAPECRVGMACPPGDQVQDGMEVSQSVIVKVRDTAKAPALITGVGERGATNISSLSFTIDDTDALKAEARAAAIADAKAKAKVLADELGVRVVRVFSYYEDDGSGMYYSEAMPAAYDSMKSSAGFGGPELPVGENTIRSQVNVTYVIK